MAQVVLILIRNIIFNSIIYSFLKQKDSEQYWKKDDRDKVIYYLVLRKGFKSEDVKGVDRNPSNLLTTVIRDDEALINNRNKANQPVLKKKDYIEEEDDEDS